VEYFIHAADTVLRIVGPKPSLEDVRDATARLAEIFQRLARPARSSITGVIGELMLIAKSMSPRHAVLAWRSATDDRFDFADHDVRIEVKATQRGLRAHHFSYEQCGPPRGTVGILASMFIESSGGGLSVRELVRRIENSLVGHHHALLRLQEVLANTLGESLMQALQERFDLELAEESLQFYNLEKIPAIRGPLPTFVSQVRFRVDLTNSRHEPPSALADANEVARRLLPQ
jgi:hypothetical protein